MIKNIFYLSFLSSIVLFSCSYENEEEAYAVKKDTAKTSDSTLIGYFNFDNNTQDSSNNKLVLNLNGTTKYIADGHLSSALDLDGNSSFSMSVGVFDTVTICFWMKNSDKLKFLPTANSNPTILDYGQGVTKFELQFYDAPDQATGATLISLTAGKDKTLFNKDIEKDFVNTYEGWNFVCIEIVNNKISAFRHYWILMEENKLTALKTNNGSVNLQDGTLIIGKAYNSSDSYFKGAIDELRVYKRALTKNEIASLKQ